MEQQQKDKLTKYSVFLVENILFENLKPHLVNRQVLLSPVVNSISLKPNNIERIQLMLVELKKSSNPNVYVNFLTALHCAGLDPVVRILEPDVKSDGQCISSQPESNNNSHAYNMPSGDQFHPVSRLIQPAVFHHTHPVNQQNRHQYGSNPYDVCPQNRYSRSFQPGLNPPSSTPSSSAQQNNDVEMTDAGSNEGTVAEYDVVRQVQMQKATEAVISPEFYTMLSQPKGYCLIINNVEFNHGPTNSEFMEYRSGSDRDAQLLEDVFTQLGYEVIMERNLPAKAKQGEKTMTRVMKNFSEMPEHSLMDSAVVVILSHGNEGDVIYGTDAEPVHMESMLKYFNNEKCERLLHKPKMFFVQACRGAVIDRGIPYQDCARDSPAGHNGPQLVGLTRRESMEDRIPRTSTWSDMMIAHSTCPGYVSIRNHTLGSWFGQAIIKIFMTRAWGTHVQDMMNLVCREIKTRYETFEGEKQAPEMIYRSWTKNLMFNVGIYRP